MIVKRQSRGSNSRLSDSAAITLSSALTGFPCLIPQVALHQALFRAGALDEHSVFCWIQIEVNRRKHQFCV